jgi:hypothetical protein
MNVLFLEVRLTYEYHSQSDFGRPEHLCAAD